MDIAVQIKSNTANLKSATKATGRAEKCIEIDVVILEN